MDDRRHGAGEEVTALDAVDPQFVETNRTRLIQAACGFFCFVSLSTLPGCDRSVQPSAPPVVMARVGVSEAEVSAPDMGLPQIQTMFTAEGLTFRGHDGRAKPRLAESWTQTPDGLTWRFKLREGVTFHDGQPITAEGVADTLKAVVANPRGLGMFPGLAEVVSIRAESPSVLVIRLRRRSTFLLEDLAYPITRRREDKSIVGTGGFKTVKSVPTEIVMERNESYHQGAPEIDRLVFRPYPTIRTAWASLMRSEIDILWDVPRDAVEFVGSSDVALYSYQRTYIYAVALNNKRPGLKERAVRRALNAAIDRDALIRDTLKGQGVAASGPLWTQHWAYDATLRGYSYDPSLAVAILDAAGYKPRERPDGRRARLTFMCLLPDKWLTWERIALDVQKQLYDVGIEMQLEPVPADEFNRRIQAGEFDAAMIEMLSGTIYARPYAFWRSADGERASQNVFGYRNATADRWFDAIRAASGEPEYRAAASQLQRSLLEDPPALFLAWSQRTRAISRRFRIPVEPGQDPIGIYWRWALDNNVRTTP